VFGFFSIIIIKTKELAVSNVCADKEQALFAFSSVNSGGKKTVLLHRSLKNTYLSQICGYLLLFSSSCLDWSRLLSSNRLQSI